jgi:transcription elongation GreA/GreB family factor
MLTDELGQLRIDLATQASAGAQDDGVVHLPVFKAARRLGVLSAVLDAAEKVHEPERAVIGRRVTLLEEEGDSVTYALVFPGDGDPVQGWISADSPLGSAVMGCAPGDRVEVMAPAGPRVITVLSVE